MVHKDAGGGAMAKWKCPGCARVRTTAFCPTCGEKPLRPRDLGLGDLAGQFARGLSSVDGKLAAPSACCSPGPAP
jgi:hypothetical protein